MDRKISVIIPIYNVEQYLKRCLDSVCNQTYTNLEIILVNDGSSDLSLNICREYEKKDKRIILISQVNKGLSGARNTGLEKASGDYVAFLDSDDYIHPQMYELLLKAIKEYETDIALCRHREFSDENIVHAGKEILKVEAIWNKIQALKQFQIQTELACYAWNKLYKRHVIDNLAFKQGLVGAEDWKFNVSALLNVNKAVLLENQLYFYFQRMDSITHEKKERDAAYYKDLAEIYMEQGIKFWECGDEKFAIENANYCLNRLARFSARKEVSCKKDNFNVVRINFKKLYEYNKKYINQMQDGKKIILAKWCFPLYKFIVNGGKRQRRIV